MCLIAWNWQPDSATPLLLLANRDEFYDRAARRAHWWPGAQVLAGQDLRAGGTWLGVSRSGRLAALTNYRQAGEQQLAKPSRGTLVVDFLQGNLSAQDYLADLSTRAADFNPFNLLLFDGRQLLGFESRRRAVVPLRPGIGGVSNADFDTPWPKLLRLKQGLHHHSQATHTQASDLLPLLQDGTQARDADLPQTGVPLELERLLSSTWIASPHYGTRNSTVVQLERRQVSFFEQTYGPVPVSQSVCFSIE